MATEIKAPVFPESVADGTIATWHKQPGEAVSRDEVICDIETDKVVLEVVAPADGSISAIIKNEGDTVLSAEVIATFEEGAVSGAAQTQAVQSEEKVEQAAAQTQAGNAPVVERAQVQDQAPAVRKALTETGIAAADVDGTGRGGRITKEDVANHQTKPAVAPATPLSVAVGERIEKRVPMTRLRKRVAERLLAATQQTAMLTTFNEVNMKPIMEMRKQYKDAFEKRHGARLGFMSFFVKACTEALKRYPAVNASIDGDDIIYHGYYDIGVAVSSDRGLVVPVLRDTDRMNYAEVESGIGAYAAKAREGKLSIEEMTGGTFTITNGGTVGSLLSPPLLNQPQSAL
jgi:2-oxoglutarate dehydrogenase E2 component (dihydrolipoamide succinyltransferase)